MNFIQLMWSFFALNFELMWSTTNESTSKTFSCHSWLPHWFQVQSKKLNLKNFLVCLKLLSCGVEAPNKVEEEEEEEVNQALESGKSQI